MAFDGNNAHNWKIFEEEFEIYAVAALHGKEKKVQAYTSLNLAGPEAIKRYKNFESEDGEDKDNPDILIQKFKEICNPQKNVSMEQHIFFMRDQKQGESVMGISLT